MEGSSTRSPRQRNHFDDHQFARAVIWAMYLACRRKAGRGLENNSGTLQNRHPEGIHRRKRNTSIRRTSMRLVIDTFEFGVRHAEVQHHFHQWLITFAEAGSTATKQELAFHAARRLEYVNGNAPRPRYRPIWCAASFFFNRRT